MSVIETIDGYANFIVSCSIGSASYHFRFHSFRSMLYCDVTVDDAKAQSSVRCVNNAWLVPTRFAQDGNFRVESDTEDYPTGVGMGKTCRLVYYTQDEIRGM